MSQQTEPNEIDKPTDCFIKYVLQHAPEDDPYLTVHDLENITHYDSSTIRKHLHKLVDAEEVLKNRTSRRKRCGFI